MLTNLLATGVDFAKFMENVSAFFVNFSVLHAIEILFFFAMIFFTSKVLRDNGATKLMVVYWVMLLAGGAMHIFDGEVMNEQFFMFYVVILTSVMLIMFSVEAKKYFWDVHKSKSGGTENLSKHAEIYTQADTERCILNIVKALQNMSKNNVGALIVLSRGSLPKQVVQSGVSIDAEISTQMIEGVFFPKAPLHDGAMIIHGYKIQAAGCFLPLTQKTSYPKEYGTRHRAGIGITEVANVISLIVSEETGIISVVKQGNVTRYADYDMLVDTLKDYYWQDMALNKKNGGNRS